VIVEFEFDDGSTMRFEVADYEAAWAEVRRCEPLGILSAWRDDEPWFGLCTDMREGTP
jgi:hypothetical protein